MKNKVLKFVILIIVFSILITEVCSCISYATETDGGSTVTPPTTQTPEPTPEPKPDPTPTPTPEPDPTPTPEPKPEEPKNEVTNSTNNEVSSNTTNNTIGNTNTSVENNTVENNTVDENVVDEEPVEEEKPEHIVSAETNYDRGATKSVDLSKVGIKNLKVYAINSKGKKEKVSLEEEFEMQGYNYTCKVDKDVEKLEFEYTESNKDIKVEIIGNDDLNKSNNTIIILARDTGLGRIATYQIKVLKDIEEVVNAEVVEQETEVIENNIVDEKEEKNIFQEYKIQIVIGAIVLALIILIIILKVKQHREYGKGRRAQNKKSSKR